MTTILAALQAISTHLEALNTTLTGLGQPNYDPLVNAIGGIELAIGRAESGVYALNVLTGWVDVSVSDLQIQKLTRVTMLIDFSQALIEQGDKAYVRIPYVSGDYTHEQIIPINAITELEFIPNDAFLRSDGIISLFVQPPMDVILRIQLEYTR